MNTTTTKTAKQLLDVKLEINELKGKELLLANELSTKYLKECYNLIQDITVQKEMFKKIRIFKSELLEKIQDENKILNTVLNTLNKALKNSNEKTINLLKLSAFSTVSKYSKLSNSNQKAINNNNDITALNIDEIITNLLKVQNKELRIASAKKLLRDNGVEL